MDLCRTCSLEIVNKDIYILRDLMLKVIERFGRDDELVVEINQFLVEKLNHQYKLLNPIGEKEEEYI